MVLFDDAALFCSLAVEALTHYLPPIGCACYPGNMLQKPKGKKIRLKRKPKHETPIL